MLFLKGSIGADWDESRIINCPAAELAQGLRETKIMQKEENQPIQLRFISITQHTMALAIIDDTAYFYNPNSKAGFIICQNEEELAKILLNAVINYSQGIDAIGLTIDDVSFGHKNHEFDELLAANEIINHYPRLQKILQQYKAGFISRQDTAFSLHQHTLSIINSHQTNQKHGNETLIAIEKMIKFNDQLNDYLIQHPPHYYINKKCINVGLNEMNESILFDCCRNGNLQIIQQLIKDGANVNIQSKDGQTPLHYAVHLNHTATMNQLLDLSADINKKNKNGYTPLIYAASNNNLDAVSLLIKAGADINVKAGNLTAQKIAELRNFNNIAIFLQQRQTANEVIADHNELKQENLITKKLAILFNSYAFPPFLTGFLTNRTEANKQLAIEMAKTLQLDENKHWDATQCKAYLDSMMTQKVKANINPTGTFRQFMQAAYQLIDDQISQVNTSTFSHKK